MCVGVKGCGLCTKTVCEPTRFGILGTEMFFSSFFVCIDSCTIESVKSCFSVSEAL